MRADRLKYRLHLASTLFVAQSGCASSETFEEPPVESNAARMLLASGVYVGGGTVLSNWHVCTTNDRTSFYQASETDGPPYVEGNPLCVFEGDPPSTLPGCEELSVSIDHASSTGRVVFAAKELDLCLVQLDAAAVTPALPSPLLIDTRPVQVGESVVVSGYPMLSVERVTERCKVVQEPRLLRDPDRVNPSDSEVTSFGIDCKTPQHGSSGSPVYNERGDLLGLVWTRECKSSPCEGVTYVTAASSWRQRLSGRSLDQYARLDALLRLHEVP